MHRSIENPSSHSPRPVLVMSSGGKDSLLTLARLRDDPEWEVCALITTVNESNGRVAMHGTSEQLIRAQAESLGLPVTLIGLPENCDNTEYEKRLAAGLEAFRAQGIEQIACGDLFLADIRQWREALFNRLGWQPIFPLWQEPTDALARTLAGPDWTLTICCIDTHVLDHSFLGRRLDEAFLADLPDHIDPCGENGEFHSFVHAGPGFAIPLNLKTGKVIISHDRYAMLELYQ